MSDSIDPRDVRIAHVALFEGSRLAEDEIEHAFSHPERIAFRARYSPGFFGRLEGVMGAMKAVMLRAAMECAQTPADRALIERLIAEESL